MKLSLITAIILIIINAHSQIAFTNLTDSEYIFNDNVNGLYADNKNGQHALNISAAVELIVNNAEIIAADGGHVPFQTGGEQSGRGGNAINYVIDYTTHNTDLRIEGGKFFGGNGGVVTNQYNTYQTPGLLLIHENVKGSSGGHGFFSADTAWGFYAGIGSVAITNAEFYGGDGGVATNMASGAIYADAGHGIFLNNNQLIQIQGGNFVGGAGGNSPTREGRDGLDALFRDNSQIIISGGTFTNGGIKVESIYFHDFSDSYGIYEPQKTTFSGGEASSLTVSSIDDDALLSLYPELDDISERFTSIGYFGSNDVTITGGVIGDLLVEGNRGSSISMTGGVIENNFSITGSGSNTLSLSDSAIIADINVAGSTYNALSLTSSVTNSGKVSVEGGVTDVNAWGDDHFMDTTVSGGVLNFNNQDFNLVGGATLALTASDAVVNFNGGRATVKSGGLLDVSAGSVTANELQVESGGSVKQTMTSDGSGGFDVSEIASDTLTVDAGAQWELYNDGSFTDFNSILGTDGFLLAAASSSITNNLRASDIQLTGLGVDAFWLYGISDLHVVTNGGLELYARYGIQDLATALSAEGDLAILLGLMQPLVESSSDARDLLIGFGSSDMASAKLTSGFLRTAEMANSLSSAQSVLADQIGLRTREHLRSYQLAGKTGPEGARGPSSWWDQSMNWLGNRMPEFNMRDSMRSMQERAPSVSSSGSWTEAWPNVDVRDSMRSVSDQTGSIDLSTEKPPVRKAWVSGSSESAVPSGWVRALSDRSPDLSPSLRLPTRYQTWGRAYVADVDQERVDGFDGYDASVVGGVVGVDRRFDQAVLGLAGGLSEMTVTGATGHNGEATSLQGTAYASYFTDLFYLNAHVSYAVSDVETTEVEDFGYSANYDANNLSFFVGVGFGLKSFNNSVLFTPEVSLLSTRYARDGYTSSSSNGFVDREFDSYDQWSHQSEVGAAVSMVRVLDSARLQMAFQPELRAHWVHQFEPEMDAESYRFTDSVDTLNAQLQAREEDLIRLGAGVRFWNWSSQTTEFGLNLDHLTGGSYAEWMVSGHFIHRF